MKEYKVEFEISKIDALDKGKPETYWITSTASAASRKIARMHKATGLKFVHGNAHRKR